MGRDRMLSLPAHLPWAVGPVAGLLDHYGYLAVGILILLEDFGVPAPGETVLILAAAQAGSGRLNIIIVALAAVTGAIIGDNIGYAIGHFGGRPLLDRFGRYVLLTPARLDKAQRFIDRHGGKVVTIARFVEGLRQANGLIAGATGMVWRKFLVFNALGAVLWAGAWSALGYALGDRINAVYGLVRRYELYVIVIVVPLAVAFIVWRIVRARREMRQQG